MILADMMMIIILHQKLYSKLATHPGIALPSESKATGCSMRVTLSSCDFSWSV